MVITLIGYRGTGKSAVGALLASRLGYHFADLDLLIETRAGKSIARIFGENGEPEFRRLESEILAEQVRLHDRVISSGGGAILDPANRNCMRAAGPIVWLQASIPVILARLQHDASTAERRPPLTGTDAMTEVGTVLAQRMPLYQEIATLTLSTDERTPDQLVEEVLDGLRLRERLKP
jgi:shikimate kinase